MTLKKITALDLRDRLGEHLDRAFLRGEAFLITRSKHPKAVLLGASQFVQLMERLKALESGGRVKPLEPEQPSGETIVSTDQLKRMIR